MGRINERYQYKTTPIANERSVIQGEKYRFTVLTSRLIRIEYSETGKFEDRATQIVVNREFGKPEINVKETDERLVITTEHCVLTYLKGRAFNKNSLSIRYTGENPEMLYGWTWYYNGKGEGGYVPPNLKGTIRTLDGISGETELDDGILTRGVFSELDDSQSLIIADDGWVDVREECVDLYVFAYAKDYLAALKDFYRLTGKPPLIPRYALGNMWSRFHKYTQNEYLSLMDRFAEKKCPLSVAVLDMDWHLVEYDRSISSGWTGYTWNKELFPNYKEFLKELDRRGLKVTLNLHPSDGVAPYEEMYHEMATAMEIDPDTKEPVCFDAANPKFIEKYFEILHHPYEKDGVTFWWIDWQQGNTSEMPGLDPLWMLNHYHAVDMESRGKRPMMLSRYSGPGSHRYPVGFSGDCVIDWESLDFQPYFTVCASNIGYCWWSHDIGGHMLGYRDDELIARWTQFGVFSPIFRLHSSAAPFLGKEPWNYDEKTEKSMIKFMQFRHKMIPYLYAMNYRLSEYGEPLMMPLYYKTPNDYTVYDREYRNEYYFGSELLVSPITRSADQSTGKAFSYTYLPQGIWFDIFENRMYAGGRKYKTYRDIYHMPVFAKAGAILPLAELNHELNRTDNPEKLRIMVYPGTDNRFVLYEDDGFSTRYRQKEYATTEFVWNWTEDREFIIRKPEGDLSVIPQSREYTLEFKKITEPKEVKVIAGGKEIPFQKEYSAHCLTLLLSDATDEIRIRLDRDIEIARNDYKSEILDFIIRFQGDHILKDRLYSAAEKAKDASDVMTFILGQEMDENVRNVIYESAVADFKI